MNILIILNDPPYGTERTYNGLRLAGTLSRQGIAVKVFLIGDAASAAKGGQSVPNGYYSIERMLAAVGSHGGAVGVCGSCMDARGIRDPELVPASHRSSMDELAAWTLEADKVLTF